MSPAFLRKLGVFASLLLLVWLVRLYREVPHAKTPFNNVTSQSDRIVLEQDPKKVELKKQGNSWKVVSDAGTLYVADAAQVTAFLSTIKDVQIEDEISDRLDRAAEYEVNPESGTRVSLFDKGGAKLAEGLFGKQAPDYAHIYFRYPDKPNVYLARGVIRGELGKAEVNSWRSRDLIDIPETKIQAITMEGKGFKTELVRTSTDSWTANGKILEVGPVNALVGTLAHLRGIDFVDPAAYPNLTYEGLTNGRVTVKGTDQTIELRIGAEDAKSKRFPVSTSKELGLLWLTEPVVQSLQQKPTTF